MLDNVHCTLFCRGEVTTPQSIWCNARSDYATDCQTLMCFANWCLFLRRRFGVMPEAKVAIVMFSAAFFQSEACVEELIKICTQTKLSRNIIPVCVQSHHPLLRNSVRPCLISLTVHDHTTHFLETVSDPV
jgi:hypothetical protein